MTETTYNATKENKSLLEQVLEQPYLVPFVNITENNDEFKLVIDLPGVDKENLDINVENNFLTVIGKVNASDNGSKFILKEKRTGNYIRKFKLADSVDQEKISAKLENGQLLVGLPKKDRVKARNIEIK